MDTEALAKQLIQHINKPCLYMRDLTDITGMSNTNMSMHEKRKNIKLAHTPPESRGRGAKILYPFSDLIEVIALSELVRMNQPTQIDGEPVAFKLSNIIFRQIDGLAYPNREYTVAVPGGKTVKKKAADSRYAVLFEFTEGAFDIHTNSKPEPPFETDEGAAITWWIMDCQEVALNIVRVFNNFNHALTR
jgi:hypothetical protein